MDEEAAAREEDVAPSGTRLLILLLIIVVVVLGLFVLYTEAIYYLIPAWRQHTWLPSVPVGGMAMAARGQFGDMFGFITALFTGLGFAGVAVTLYAQWSALSYQTKAQGYLAEQIKLLKESTDAETSAVRMQRSATSMDILTRMRETFDSKELRKSRYVASTFFLDAQRVWWRTHPRASPAQDTAIRDILSFFEQMAHFTNRNGIDADMVLNAFYIRLEAYYYFAEKRVLPAEHASSVAWAEIRKLREKGLEWLKLEYVMQGFYESKDDVPDSTVESLKESQSAVKKHDTLVNRREGRSKTESP
jgi:hypothetical protein